MGDPLIAVRIKDGIFVGNVTAAHDEDFLFMNKVTHIVNCAGSEVKDLYEDTGIQYLSFPWKDSTSGVCTTVMFDSGDRNIEAAVRFIDQGLEGGECVLVHSFHGVSRSCALISAYFMVKYGWQVDNALKFLTMAHPDTAIKPYFMRQLRTFAKRHNADVDVFNKEIDEERFGLDNDQWMLRNTLLNGLTTDEQAKLELHGAATGRVDIHEVNYKNPMKRRRRLMFFDTKQGTHVKGAGTTPVQQPRPHHVDPLSGAFSGSQGVAALRTKSADTQSILARRGTPNRHRLESDPETQPRGRQVLFLRQSGAPQSQRQTPAVQHPAAHQQQPPQQQQQAPLFQQLAPQTHSTMPYQRSNAEPSTQQQVSTPRGRDDSPMGYPNASRQTGTEGVLRSNAVASRAGPREAPMMTQQSTSAARPANAVVRSPFAIGSGTTARKGSPLPPPRQQAASSTAQSSQRRPVASSNTQPTSLRYASPHAIPSLSAAQHSERQQVRAGSPVGRPVARTSSPIGHAQPTGSSASSIAQRRAGSPMSRTAPSTLPRAQATITPETIRAMSGIGGSGAGAGTVQRGPQPVTSSRVGRTSSPMTQQRRTYSPVGGPPQLATQARANSPMSRQFAGTPTQRTDSPTRSALGARTTAGAPSARTATGSPIGGRTGTNSPMRGATNSPRGNVSLAEQYLGMGPIGGGGGSRVSRETNSTILRRQQNTVTAHR